MELVSLIIMIGLATLAGSYLAASIIFLRYPHLLHRRKRLRFTPRHISHRGGAGENCENTISAFRHALRHGTQMLEIDCHLTRDGEVIVMHDAHLLNKCSMDAKVAEVDLADLPNYKPVLTVDFKPGFTINCGEDRKIPTLREVFTHFPNTPMNIDIKVNNEELMNKVHALIKEYRRQDLTIWGSKQNEINRKLRKIDPTIPMFFSFRRVLTILVFFYTGLLPFVPLHESALEIVMPSIALKKGQFVIEFSAKFKWALRMFDVLLMRPALFRHLERRGIQTYLWVLNDEEDWTRGYKLGAAGLMTDFPSKLAEFLRKNPQYKNHDDGGGDFAEADDDQLLNDHSSK